MYGDKAIKEYLDELSSDSAVPGGGSAAALVGATGAACLEKALNFTIGKEKYKSVEKEMADILKRLEAIRKDFIRLCSEDAAAYGKLSEAFKTPAGAGRAEKIQQALKKAVEVPLSVCRNACEAFKFCADVRDKGNKNLVSDVDCAASMLKCAYESARINAEINLKSIEDKQCVEKTKKALDAMEGGMR